MRLELVHLSGTSREPVELGPGLNIITGPISTGKSTFIRMCRAALGANLEDLPHEARSVVSAISARMLLNDARYQISRPYVTTKTAVVDIAAERGDTWRLPAMAPLAGAESTYGQWLLRQLQLPVIRVPLSEGTPDATATLLSINDYMLYCTLTQDEIDTSVLGHTDYYRNIKRRYVFGMLYGLYSAEVATLQEELRGLLVRIQHMDLQERALAEALRGTPYENRARLERDLSSARAALQALEQRAVQGRIDLTPPVQALRNQVLEMDRVIGDTSSSLRNERAAVAGLERLANQLEFQVSKLTRSIVADELFSDIEFRLCPRCGSALAPARAEGDHCVLCLQHATPKLDRRALVQEQTRITKQVQETQDLINRRGKIVESLEAKLTAIQQERTAVAHHLDLETQVYVSDAAARIGEESASRARLDAEIRQLGQHLAVVSRVDSLRQTAASLELRRAEVEAEISERSARGERTERSIRALEGEFSAILDRFQVPRFGEAGNTRIDRETYLPVVHGRRFNELSSLGLKVLVNVAHVLAHQRNSISLSLPLPNILFIDGLTSNISHEDADLARVQGIYEYLIELSNEVGDRLQIIVADQDVPREAERYVRLRLAEDNRLIPRRDLDEGDAPRAPAREAAAS